MENRAIAELAAKVLYLKNADAINHGKSLFLDYNMSSIEFVDFAYEVNAAAAQPIPLGELWPVERMATDAQCFAGGRWTAQGAARLREIFRKDDLSEATTLDQLRALFSIEYIAGRLARQAAKECAHV